MADSPNVRQRTTSHTLAEFNERALKCHDCSLHDFMVFALTGIYRPVTENACSGPEEQAFIDTCCDARNVVDDQDIMISRYYASAIGISRDILVNVPITMHTSGPYLSAFNTPLFIQRQVEYQDSLYSVDYNRIPNFEFGIFGGKSTLNIIFPGLWSTERDQLPLPRRLTAEEYDLWYGEGLLPAIRKLRLQNMEENICPIAGRSLLPVQVAFRLMEEARSFLSSNVKLPNWTREFFVVHIVKGMSHSPLLSAELSEQSLNHFLYDSGLHASVPGSGEWYIDVGIQVTSRSRRCLQWMTSAHATLAREALSSIDDVDAARLTQCGTKGYRRDMANHLDAVSGFHIFPGTRFPGYKAIRAYTSDEDLFVRSDGLYTITVDEVLSQGPPVNNAPPTIQNLLKVLTAARDASPSKARLEVRVPLQRASGVLLDVDSAAITQSVLVFESRDWWNFRLIRVLAAKEALIMQSRDADSRFLPANLTLTAALIWLVNGFSKYPDTTPASRSLMDVVLPVTKEADDEYARDCSRATTDFTMVQNTIHNPLGCIFLRRLTVCNDALCFSPGGPTLPTKVFQTLFNGMTPEALKARYQSKRGFYRCIEG